MNPRSMQWQILAAGAVEGNLSKEEMEQLMSICAESAEARHALGRLLAVDRLLPLAMESAEGSLAAREAVMRIEQDEQVSMEMAWKTAERARRWLWQRRLKRVGTAAAALAVIGLGAWWLAMWQVAPASVMRSEGMVWVGTPPSFTEPDLARGQRLQGANGLLELGFRNGARVVLEGPFDVELRDETEIYLRQGRISVRCPSSAYGFKVVTEQAEVVDLGTEFCVSLEEEGKMEVHVLEGAVEAKGFGHAKTTLLAGEAVRLSKAGVKRMEVDASAFVTDMPSRKDEPIRFIHWSFDEPQGAVVEDRGRGFIGGDSDTRLLMKQFGKKAEEPKRTAGVFGGGLSFAGDGGYAETEFPGIAGNQGRSIALWVRVPKDVGVYEGHGIVSWGTVSGPRAWQLSANTTTEGLKGRLRIGTYDGGCVIGTTDLRDGQWHHVAVVMYAGSRPNLSTNVLLYVDGKKETVSRRTLTEIQTNVLEAGHGVWMGRNIVYTDEAARKGAPKMFFRGDVDEVFIVDAALSQDQIVRMMRNNEPPG
ncbi:hypothetical protein FEM03_20660 [Phragmitibacter flavus]|uniref:FecR protein domain-containing protein n=1 Tax=Phragmitibacter flavus TaxID=2576071 RepID=A0A5R8KAE1_9BACT|nr:LamG-like jellyroll fold domain-containing protein [Phragmitibacter flavus]TLD68885.1 hypothetical protein FEM03_20660 [Phragmitibacter flavus]